MKVELKWNITSYLTHATLRHWSDIFFPTKKLYVGFFDTYLFIEKL